MKTLNLIVIAILALGTASLAAADGSLPASLSGLGLRESALPAREMPGWQAPGKIVLRSLFGDQALATLQQMHPDVEIVGVRTVDEALAAAPGAQAIVGFCRQDVFDAATDLHWVQVYFAGVENCVTQPTIASGEVILSNGQRLGSPTLADHAIALMMSLTRGLYPYALNQQKAQWEPNWSEAPPAFGEVSGRTMLVVGLGGIGTQVAKRAHGLGMRVTATRNSRREGPDYISYVGLADEALKLAANADVVVNAAPLTSTTRGMFNAEFFKAMKPGAYFISVGRGQSTVTADLLTALEDGEIAGAGLDVTDPEPLPSEHPLWRAPNLIITPHVAGRSQEALGRIQALVVENVGRYVAGDRLLSVVDVERGY